MAESTQIPPLNEADAAQESEAKLLSELTTDLKRLQQQKSRVTGSIEGRIIQNVCFANGEHYVNIRRAAVSLEQREKNRVYAMFNLIGPRMTKLMGRLTAFDPPMKAVPEKRDPKSIGEGEVVDRFIRALDHKLNQPARFWEILYWIMVAGVAFEHISWIPNSTVEPVPQFAPNGEVLYTFSQDGQAYPESAVVQMIQSGVPKESFEILETVDMVGDVGSEILSPLNVFIDNSVRSVADLAPDQRVYVAKIRTMGWVEENFGVEIEPMKNFTIVQTQFIQPSEDHVGGTFLKDLIPLVQGSNDDTDMPMTVVVEAYNPPSSKNPHGRYTVFIPGLKVLYDGENPYEEVPIVDYHWRPVTTSFWTADYISDLIPPQKFLNKRLSQLGEQSNATLYSSLLLGPGVEASDIVADQPGVVRNGLAENGAPLIGRLPPPEFPSWFMPTIEMTVQLFNDIAGGADLFQESKFPGQLRGPMAVPMLQEILDTQWGPLFNHLGERLARSKQMRLNRVQQFYPPIRTLHYVDRDMRDEVIEFHTDEVLRSGNNFKITIERGSLLPEIRALREARILERLAGPLAILYMDERTGKLDKSKIAADLQFGDAGRESRENQYRKLAIEINDMIWEGKQVPPVLPFYDHAVMMDELEATMATREYLTTSPPIQQAFSQRWEQHRQFLVQQAQAQQQAMMNGMIQGAVAQATQQAAAQAAAMTVESAQAQLTAQKQLPTEQIVRQANEGVRRGPREPEPVQR